MTRTAKNRRPVCGDLIVLTGPDYSKTAIDTVRKAWSEAFPSKRCGGTHSITQPASILDFCFKFDSVISALPAGLTPDHLALFRAADLNLLSWHVNKRTPEQMLSFIALARRRFHQFDPVILTMGDHRGEADLAYQKLRRMVRDQLGGFLSMAAHINPDNPAHGALVLADSFERLFEPALAA